MTDAVADAPARQETSIRPSARVVLARTLGVLAQAGTRGGDPTIRFEGGAWWLALRTETGPATLRLVELASAGEVRATAWGAGAPAALDAAPGLIGELDDADGFEPGRHPVVAELHRRTLGVRLARTGRVLDALVPSVLFQKVTGMEAAASWRALLRRHGQTAPGPAPAGMRVPPPPEVLRLLPSWELHGLGVTPQRADTLMRVLAVAPALERTVGLDGQEARRRLRTVTGVGEWTAAETVIRSHGDPDAVSFGDFHLAKAVGTALVGHRVDDDGLCELLEPWRGHRQRVVRLVELSGIRYERHGPRFPVPGHRAD